MAGEQRMNRIAGAFEMPAAVSIVTVFSISLIFVMAYGSSFIYLIGYTNQLLPLFEGIILGVIVFTSAGSFIAGRKISYLYGAALIAVILFIVFLLIIVLTQMVVPNNLLTVLALMITAPYMPVSAFAMSFFKISRARKIIVPAASSVIGILSIAYIAIIYEASGQNNLASITGLLVYLSLISLAILFIAVFFTEKKRFFISSQ